MKTTDIEIGQEYAVKNPNEHYSSPIRVVATRKGVHGPSPKSNPWESKSKHANFIEFDLVEGYNYFDYKVTLGADGHPSGRGNPSTGDRVFRATPSHFLCTWDDHVAEKAQEKADERAAEERRAKYEAKGEAALKGLKDLGVKSAYLHGGRICVPVESVEEILSAVQNNR